jgi:hypothetical protein
LQDLDWVNIFQQNDAFILKTWGKVKQMLKDYEGVLQNLDHVDILEPNDTLILKTWGDMKQMLYDYEITL